MSLNSIGKMNLESDAPSKTLQALTLAQEYKLAQMSQRIWLVIGICFWPVLIVSYVYFRRMQDIEVQAKLLDVHTEWKELSL